ncbi:MAG TPA: S46 family peptidase [Vicinamibacterales bacterium]|nr:S46 family peptidase [Vicinamibacterales bacterium]
MKTLKWTGAAFCAAAGATLLADEGMWRIDQLPREVIAQKYGVRLTDADLDRLRYAPVRIQAGGSGGTGTFASAHGLILTNHHVALDCIRTSTLAEQNKANADNLIDDGFTAKAMADELPCKRFAAQVERSARDVTKEVNAGVKPGMAVADVQRVRQAARSDLERSCSVEKGDNFACDVVDFNSGAQSMLIVYEEYKDIRLVYAPEKQLGYFGGDEMNFRFPRYVSDISILRAYVGENGAHGEYDQSHVPLTPDHMLHVTMAGVKDGDFTLVSGNPANTNRYRESYSADYNLRKGIPNQIEDLEMQLGLLRKYAAMKPDYQVALQSQIFGLANSLKYQQDVLAALKSTDVVAERRKRERDFNVFLDAHADLKKEFGGVLDAQAAVYANDVEANADLDAALGWFERSDVLNYAVGLHEFSTERAKPSDRDREPQFQQRNWPDVRAALLNDDPVIPALEEDLLTIGFEKAIALPADRRIPAVQNVVAKAGASAGPRELARAVLSGTHMTSLETRQQLIDAAPSVFESSTDPAIVFARAFIPAMQDQRQRTRVLSEKLLSNRSGFARGLQAMQASTGKPMYPDANFTLRVAYGHVAGYTSHGKAARYTTTFGDMFALAQSRGNKGDFGLPKKLQAWRASIGDAVFRQKYASLPVDFVSTNDITGGNSGSSILNQSLEIVGLIFDGNEEAMAGDWTYSEVAGRALSTDIRFALTIARDVHGAGWIVDELLQR